MPKLISIETECDVKRLSKEGYSCSQIKEKLSRENINISEKSVYNIIKNKGIKRNALSKGLPKPKNKYPKFKRTPAMIAKVKSLVTKKNPATYRSIRNEFDIQLGTICNIIHKDLNLNTRRKTKVHKLKEIHKKKRKTNSRKLYENFLAGDRSEYAVTLDEAMVYIDDANGERKICYVKAGESVPESWVLEGDESFKNGFMVIGIITGRGTFPLFRVPVKVKINAKYYIDFVLEPLFTAYLPLLYKKEMKKVFFHHDMASCTLLILHLSIWQSFDQISVSPI